MLPPKIWAQLFRLRYLTSNFFVRANYHIHKSERFRGCESGKDVYIIGSGPSVASQDLSMLFGQDIISLSNTYLHPDFSKLKPKYHVLAPFTYNTWEGASEQQTEYVKDMQMHMPKETTLVMHIGDFKFINSSNFFSGNNIIWYEHVPWERNIPISKIELKRLPSIWSISETAITVSIFLGYDRINLLGIDHDWFNATVVHFFDEEKNKLKPGNFYNYVDSEFQMVRHAAIFNKYKMLKKLHGNIYNLNSCKNTYLDVFPLDTIENSIVRSSVKKTTIC